MHTPLRLTRCTVCRQQNPMGVDVSPRFGWECEGDGFSRSMSGWQIVVSSTAGLAEARRGDVWDSGRREGESACELPYEGRPLESKTIYYWSARVWDETGLVSDWSETSSFETGILPDDAWQGSWIGARTRSIEQAVSLAGAKWIWDTHRAAADSIPQGKQAFRRTVQVREDAALTGALFAFSVDKQGECYCNGEPIGPSGPWQSGAAYSLLPYLHPGDNLIAVEGNNLFEGYAGFAGKLLLTYDDGQQDVVVTDRDWKTSDTPGQGWILPGYDDAGWNSPDQALEHGCEPWGAVEVNASPMEPSPAPLLRREFTLQGRVQKARAYVCGLGLFDLWINGGRPDDTVLNPAHTQYDRRVFYRVFDITALLREGANAAALELGNSFFNETIWVWNWPNAAWRDYPKCRVELTVWYEDGRCETIASDRSWKVTLDGPTRFDSVYYGETVDARKISDGFALPGFDDAAWSSALAVPAPAGRLVHQCMEPMRRTRCYEPEIHRAGEGSVVLEAPEMLTGWAALRFDAPEGTEITISYGERLNPDGTLEVLGQAQSDWYTRDIQQDRYVCRGGGEWFEPKFSYKGFRYIQIDGYPGELTAADAKLYRIHNDVEQRGWFDSSQDRFCRLHDIMVRTIVNNLQGKPTDTPVWEKNGWTGDANVACESMCCNFDLSLFLPKFLHDLGDAQDETGSVPQIAPTANWAMENTPVWNSIFILATKKLRDQFGLRGLMEEQYEGMRRLMELTLVQLDQNGGVWGDLQLADWVSPAGGSDPWIRSEASSSEGSGICATGYVFLSLRAMADLAGELGRAGDAERYRQAADRVKKAFHKAFYREDEGVYQTGHWQPLGERTRFRQTSQLVPLAFGLAEGDCARSAAEALARDIRDKGNHLDTGMVGTKLLLPVLCDWGYEELALRLLRQETYPSWGYWLACGSTTTWEIYERVTRSEDHYFLGTYDEWFFRYLCGIRSIREGGSRLEIRPLPLAGEWANAGVPTGCGIVESGWQREENQIRFTFFFPVGAKAKVVLPVDLPVTVECGEDVVFTPCDGGVTAELGSGRYSFLSNL